MHIGIGIEKEMKHIQCIKESVNINFFNSKILIPMTPYAAYHEIGKIYPFGLYHKDAPILRVNPFTTKEFILHLNDNKFNIIIPKNNIYHTINTLHQEAIIKEILVSFIKNKNNIKIIYNFHPNDTILQEDILCNTPLEFINKQNSDEKSLIEIVKRNGKMLQFIPDSMKSEQVCEEAFYQNAWSILYLPDGLTSVKTWMYALYKTDLSMIDYVPDKFIKQLFCDIDIQLYKELVIHSWRKNDTITVLENIIQDSIIKHINYFTF